MLKKYHENCQSHKAPGFAGVVRLRFTDTETLYQRETLCAQAILLHQVTLSRHGVILVAIKLYQDVFTGLYRVMGVFFVHKVELLQGLSHEQIKRS